MSSLRTILNPPGDPDMSHRSGSESVSPSPHPEDQNPLPKANHAIDPSRLAGPLEVHSPHPNCPDRLSCLPESTGRPQHTLPVILRCAILGSPNKRLTIREIYSAMEEKYPYYKTAGTTWKQSVRHHLSLNRLFERQPRPVTDPGFGSYWTVNLEAPPGTKRPRKRGRPNKGPNTSAENDDISPTDFMGDAGALDHNALTRGANGLVSAPGEPPRKRSRGSARSAMALQQQDHLFESNNGWSGPSENAEHLPSMRPLRQRYEDDDEDEDAASRMSDDDDYMHRRFNHVDGNGADPNHYGHRQPFNFHHNQQALPGPFGYPHVEDGQDINDRLQQEMDALRRRSNADRDTSHQLQSQLAAAEAEVYRVKSALKTAEIMLEEEGKKRREAERLCDEESRMRRTVEMELRNLKTQIST